MSRTANVISVQHPVTLRNLVNGIYTRGVWRKGVMYRCRDDAALGECEEGKAPDGWEIIPGLVPKSAPRKEAREIFTCRLGPRQKAKLHRIAAAAGKSMSDLLNDLIEAQL